MVGGRLPVRDAGRRLLQPRLRSLQFDDDGFPAVLRLHLAGPQQRAGQPGRHRVVLLRRHGASRRYWRYDFSSEPGYLATDSSSHVNASAAYETNAVGVGLQGVLSHSVTSGGAPNFYVDDARSGVGQHGILWRQNTSGATAAANCGQDIVYACWGQRAESMSVTGGVRAGCGRSPNGRPTAQGTGQEPTMRFRNGCCSPYRCPR